MNTTPARIAGLASIVAAIVMIIAGVATWATVSANLAEQKITVAADSAVLAGDKVDGPFSAFAQAQVIEKHATNATGGKTYAELGAEQSRLKKEAEAAGIKDITASDPVVVAVDSQNPQYAALKAQYEKFTGQRETAMTGSFLRASLFTSVVAYGVSALVIGLGLLFGLLGWALMALAKRTTGGATASR